MKLVELLHEARNQKALLRVTPENIARTKAFIFRKWTERAREDHEREEKYRRTVWSRVKNDPESSKRYAGYDRPRPFCPPDDLTDSCKFSSLFASIVFGGRMMGNQEHYYTRLPNGEILDLNAEARDVLEMLAKHQASGLERDSPYYHDELFCAQSLRHDRADVGNRVTNWLNEFSREENLGVSFTHSRGRIRIQDNSTMKPVDLKEKRVERLGNISVFVDPGLDVIRRFAKSYRNLRGLWGGGHTYLWDAMEGAHYEVEEQLGLNYFENTFVLLHDNALPDDDLDTNWDNFVDTVIPGYQLAMNVNADQSPLIKRLLGRPI